MSEYSASNDRRRERAPDYRAVFSTLREVITNFMTGNHGPLISPYIQTARKILTDLGHAIRRNMADFRNMFKRSSDDQRYPSSNLDTPRHTETPSQPTPDKDTSHMVGPQESWPYPSPSLARSRELVNPSRLPNPSRDIPSTSEVPPGRVAPGGRMFTANGGPLGELAMFSKPAPGSRRPIRHCSQLGKVRRDDRPTPGLTIGL
jgi:hypothetical protein